MQVTWNRHSPSLTRRVQAALRETGYASRRFTALRLFVGLEQPGRTPDTHAEFLLRTSATPPHTSRPLAAASGPYWVTAASMRRR